MNAQAYMDVIYLAACAVNGTTPEAGRVGAMDLEELYRAASRHLLTAAVATALESAGVRDERFTQARVRAIRKNILLEADMNDLFGRMDAAGIWHMPLKGSVLKALYPAAGMRQMADVDVLFDAARADEVRAIMEGLGFTTVYYGTGAHDVYHRPPVSNFEMHRTLFAPSFDDGIASYYGDVEARLLRGEGCARYFAPEDFYIYMIAHEYKHYSGSGTGLRSLLDTHVFLGKRGDDLDWQYIDGELDRLGIAGFERKNRSLALHLFSGQALTDEDREMLDYILDSGTYGTVEHSVENAVEKQGGRGKYLMSRLFLPMESMKMGYPFFYRHKALLPALFVYRIGRGLTVSGRRTVQELKILIASGKRA